MKKVLGILGGIAVVVGLLIAMAIGKLAGRAAVNQVTEANTEDELAKAVALANQQLPMQVDAATRLDRVSLGLNHDLMYHYTLVEYHAQGKNVFDIDIEGLKERVIPQACANTSSRSFLDEGITVVYRYSDNDGHEILKAFVQPNDCRD